MSKKSILVLSLIVLFFTSFTIYRSASTYTNDEGKVEVKYYMRKIDGHLYLTTVVTGVQTVAHNYHPFGTTVSVSTIHAASCPCHKNKPITTNKTDDYSWIE